MDRKPDKLLRKEDTIIQQLAHLNKIAFSMEIPYPSASVLKMSESDVRAMSAWILMQCSLPPMAPKP